MRFCLILSITLLGAASPGRADDLQEVIDRYVNWRGGQAYESMQSIHGIGETTLGGLHGKFEQWQGRGGLLRRNSNLGDIPSSEAVTLSGAWTTNTSGQIEDAADGGESDRRMSYMAFSPKSLMQHAKLALGPSEQRDGRTWNVVQVTFPGTDTYDLFIAPDTGELWGTRVTADRQSRFIHYADWRMVHGVRMAFEETETGTNPADQERRIVASIDINAAIPMRLFARPNSAKTWRFGAGAHATDWIDFEFFNENQIFIPASVNGNPVKLILDSGAGISVLDSAFAQKIGVKAAGALPVMGVGGQASMQIATHLTIVLGGLTLSGINAGVIDLSAVSAQLGHPMPLILGKEAFNELGIDIDFASRKIAFRDPQSISHLRGAVRISLGHHNDRRSIPVSVEGRAPVPFDFDLGNNGPLIVYASYRDQAGLLENRPYSFDLSAGVGGVVKSKIATLNAIVIGGISIPAVPTEFPDAEDNAMNSDRTAGNIGLPVFSHFRLLTDYPHDALWLISDPKRLAEPFVKDRSGLALQPGDDRLKVLLVAPGSPAESQGMQQGAEIVAVNGQSIDAHYAGSPLSRWAHQAAGTHVKLTLADGSSQDLLLRDYF